MLECKFNSKSIIIVSGKMYLKSTSVYTEQQDDSKNIPKMST